MYLLVAVPVAATRPADVPALGVAASSAAIASDQPEALDEPSEWRCEKIRPEYEEWLRTGHKAADWKFVGKTYRVVKTGELYAWSDWLDWREKQNCGAMPKLAQPGSSGAAAGGGNNALLYGGGALGGIGLLLAAMGGGGGGSEGGSGRPDSPG